MQREPIRVLHVLGTINLGGAESRVMELYRAMDKTAVQFDFLVHTDKEGYYSKEILSLGGRIYTVPRFHMTNYAVYRKAIKSFFDEHCEYAAVHGHMTSTASIYLPIAKRAGIPVTIAHARSAGVDKGIKGIATRIIRYPLKYRADYCFTCSKEAGEAVYGKRWVKAGKVWTIPNAIDVERFQYRESVRQQVRAELGLSGCFVIGHVGRFSFMKNHQYLIKVFAELNKMHGDVKLVLIGKGEQESAIQEEVWSLGLTDKVLFVGNCSDVERYYQAFDFFVFPSLFEGLPGCVVEAQTSGLHCLVSDKVTREAALTELVAYKSIEEPAVNWAAEIVKNMEEALVRKDMRAEITEKGFDVRKQAEKLKEFYINCKDS